MNSYTTFDCTDRERRIGESQTESAISAGDNQYPGSGTGKVETQVCLLDTSSASRREGDRKGQMGRVSGDSGIAAVGPTGNDRNDDERQAVESFSDTPDFLSFVPSENLFFIDNLTFGSSYLGSQNWGLYTRHNSDILGRCDPSAPTDSTPSLFSESNASTSITLSSNCFNCGSPSHVVSSCTEPFNRPLVALSRDLHGFFRERLCRNGFTGRLYTVEGWKLTRLQWLNYFVPGVIKGVDLRDALGLGSSPLLESGEDDENSEDRSMRVQEEADAQGDAQKEWLKKMVYWGYPPGWATSPDERDPREAVKGRILRLHPDDEDEEFCVFGEETEMVSLPSHVTCGVEATSRHDETKTETEDSTEISRSVTPSQPLCSRTRRWALYPPTQFSSSLLPVYNGSFLPSLEDEPTEMNVSLFTDSDVWNRQQPPEPLEPPPPAGIPPPLPPPPPLAFPPPLPPPPLPTNSAQGILPLPLGPSQDYLDDESDMDMSDEG